MKGIEMNRPISSYLLFFALAYVGMLILFAIISMFLSSAGSSGTVIAPFIAAMIIGEVFVKKESRAPNDEERNALTLGSFFIFVAINVALLALAFVGGAFGDVFSETGSFGAITTILSVLLLVVFVIVFFMMRWAYGGLTRKRAEKLLGDRNNTFD
ncbi:ABZJ_00895 family protein [Hellea sp.]|nr:ABZJ_00895 family protein [Hellea sp.]